MTDRDTVRAGTQSNLEGSDRILPLTRWVALVVIPFLLAACVILCFFPDRTAEFFAWPINPPMTAWFMGTGYLGGAFFFARVATQSRWHRVAVGFPVVTVFTIAMLGATLLHLDRFNLGTLPFYTWLVLYIVTPVLVPAVWLLNRRTDPGTLEPGDIRVPPLARIVMGAAGVVQLVFAIAGFIRPEFAIAVWPWTLSPLIARVLCGWLAFLGAGGLLMAREPRWSAWRIALRSIGLWQLLVLIGIAIHAADFTAPLVNWYTVLVAVGTVAIGAAYLWMELRHRGETGSQAVQPSS